MRSVFLWNDPQPLQTGKKWGLSAREIRAARRFFKSAIIPVNGDMTSAVLSSETDSPTALDSFSRLDDDVRHPRL
jgi:hypothetical protein